MTAELAGSHFVSRAAWGMWLETRDEGRTCAAVATKVPTVVVSSCYLSQKVSGEIAAEMRMVAGSLLVRHSWELRSAMRSRHRWPLQQAARCWTVHTARRSRQPRWMVQMSVQVTDDQTSIDALTDVGDPF